MICEKCGRAVKDAESIMRGYGPVCYKKIMPPQPKKARAPKAKEDRGSMEDWDYEVPGQMELSDIIEMPKGGIDNDLEFLRSVRSGNDKGEKAWFRVRKYQR